MKKILFSIFLFFISTVSYASSCLVIGDSIALGTAQKLTQCWSSAKVGLNTEQALMRFETVPYMDVTVVSLGVNDKGTDLPTERNLYIIRSRIHSPVVVWILPTDVIKRESIEKIAYYFHDPMIDLNAPEFSNHISQKDHIHPDGIGYAMLAMDARIVGHYYSRSF
jgi:hypothetical protein